MNNISTIKDAVAAGKIRPALRLLREACVKTQDNFYLDQVILLEGRYNRFMTGDIAGLKSEEDTGINKINSSILSLCESLENANAVNSALIIKESRKTITDVTDDRNTDLDSDYVKIAMAGRPNVGKTTLMRNILKSEVGIVGDSSNVTVDSYLEESEEVKIAFIDCPGFNAPGRLLEITSFVKDDEQLKNALEERDLLEDYYALKGIKAADLVYYVASVNDTPDKNDRSLIQLINDYNDNVIGIINMGFHLAKSDAEKSKNRTQQWERFFSDNSVYTVVNYDFSWDRPTKIHDLYRYSSRYVENEKREVLDKSLELMIRNYESSSLSISNAMLKMVRDCEGILYEIVIESDDDEKKNKKKIKKIERKVRQDVVDSIQVVIQRIKDLYGVELNKTEVDSGVSEDKTTIKSGASHKVDQVGAGVSVGGFIGGMGVLKGLAAGLTLAGAFPVVVVTAAIGGIVALFMKGRKSTQKIEFQLKEKDLLDVIKQATMILWVSSNKGYGIGSSVNEQELLALVEDKCKKLIKEVGLESLPNSDKKLRKKLDELVLSITMPKGK